MNSRPDCACVGTPRPRRRNALRRQADVGQLLGKLLGSGAVTIASTTDYLRLQGKPLAEIKLTGSSTTVTYLHPDLLGSPRMATNSSGQTLWQEHYDPYGKKLNNVAEKLGYTGHAYDQESGLTYAQARFYDGAVGRFLSIDPVGFTGDPFGFSRYSYANNNPYRYTDPTGLTAYDCSDGLGSGNCDGGAALKAGDSINVAGGVTYNITGISGSVVSVAADTPTASYAVEQVDTATGNVSGQGYISQFNQAKELGDASNKSGLAASALGEHTMGNATLGRSNGKIYTSGWRGNQYVDTVKVAKIGAISGGALSATGVFSDTMRFRDGSLGIEKFILNTGVAAAAVLTGPFGLGLGVGYGGGSLFVNDDISSSYSRGLVPTVYDFAY